MIIYDMIKQTICRPLKIKTKYFELNETILKFTLV